MKYIYTILNDSNIYSVFERKCTADGNLIRTFGICIENKTDAVYVPDITTVKEIAVCMVKVISADRITPQNLHDTMLKVI